MLTKKLEQYKIILGSASPRRKKLLSEMGIKFTVKKTEESEQYPQELNNIDIAEFLAKQKANFISNELAGNFLLITADTIVVQKEKILHKPRNKHEAEKILQEISGKTHNVISGVCLKSNTQEVAFSSETKVYVNQLSKDEITHYIDRFKPFDKAGAYGIQEWIGYIGIRKINGSYNNVVGLPTAELYQKLKLFI